MGIDDNITTTLYLIFLYQGFFVYDSSGTTHIQCWIGVNPGQKIPDERITDIILIGRPFKLLNFEIIFRP